jgi:hypothetical protein
MSEEENIYVAMEKAQGALPDGLRVLALEFDLSERRSPRPEDWFSIARAIGRVVGRSWSPIRGHVTLFKVPGDHSRMRLDMIVSSDVLARMALPGGKYDFGRRLRCGEEVRLSPARSRVFETLANHSLPFSEFAGEHDDFLDFKNCDPEDFRTEGQFRSDDFRRWVRAGQTTEKDLDRLASLLDACDDDIEALHALLERAEEKPEPVSFLVPSLVPRGVVTLLLGDKKTGKSAVAMELAVAVARKESHWLGFPLAPCKGHAVYLLGEDSPGEAARRVQSMTGGEMPDLLYIIPADGTELDGLLEKLKRQKVDFLAVDPARKYHHGNEDDSTEISNMLNKLQEFAAAKNCAVVVLHHLKRGAVIRNINDLGTSYRGSGVYTDRARVTLGLRRNGNETEFGIPAPGGTPLHNLLASEMFTGKRRLRRDEPTFRHIPIGMTSTAATGSKAASSKMDVPAETAAAVERVAVELLQTDERVTKTGKAAIFERKIPALSSLTRAATRAAVESLVADGRLCCDTAGALSLPVSASGATLEDLI